MLDPLSRPARKGEPHMIMRLLRAILWIILIVVLTALASLALPDTARSTPNQIRPTS